MKIFLDAGHNDSGHNTGATGNGLREQDLTFNTAKLCGDFLRQKGVDVMLSRPTKETNLGTSNSTSLSERCRLANEWGADYFLSVHYNAGGGTGSECLHVTENGRAFGEPVLASLVRAIGLTNRGMKKRTDLYVLNHTKMPAALIEVAFIDNMRDATVISTHQHVIAGAIADGILSYVGMPKEDKEDEITMGDNDNEQKDVVAFIAEKAGIDEKHWRYMIEYIPSIRSLFEKIAAVWGK